MNLCQTVCSYFTSITVKWSVSIAHKYLWKALLLLNTLLLICGLKSIVEPMKQFVTIIGTESWQRQVVSRSIMIGVKKMTSSRPSISMS